MAKITSSSAAGYAEYLEGKVQASELGDYYLKDGERIEAPGRWAQGAERFGLDASVAVTGEQLRTLMAVRRPDNGEQLRRMGGSGEAVAAIDATFSAPKSVSAAWAVSGPESRAQIERAHEQAVDRALRYATGQVPMLRRRVSQAKVLHEKAAGLVATSWRHTTARAVADEFDDTVSAWQLLLETAAHTVLSESFLYNAAKHGLTIVHTDESTQMAFMPPGGDQMQLLAGSQFAYLHRPQTPGVKGGTEWWVSLTHTLPDQDIETAFLIQQAVSSLWNVARRRYTGRAGEVWLSPAQAVRDAIYGPVAVKGGHVRTLTHELVKKDANGRFNGVHMHLSGRGLPDESEWSPGAADDGPAPRQIALPVRQQDKRIVSTSSRKLLPFAPNWSSRV